MNRKLRDKLILVATCLALCIPSFGQVLKGSISGTVVDPQGAVVSGAQVKATNVALVSVLTTTSDNSGSFRFNLIPGGRLTKLKFLPRASRRPCKSTFWLLPVATAVWAQSN